jgi:plastocyanin
MFALVHARRHLALAVGALAVLFLSVLSAPLAAAHPARAASTPRTWYVTAGVTTRTHDIEGMVFLPGTITIDAGDSIVWRAGSADIHTVVLPGAGGQIAPYDPSSYQPTSNPTYDGSIYTASSVLTLLPAQAGVPFTSVAYRLTFTKPGTYTYMCSVHMGMQGTVIVQAVGAAYPHTQRYYDEQARGQRARLLAEGRGLYDQAEDIATSHHVAAGISNDDVGVMRFVRQTVTIHVGQSVTFTNMSMDPHTVTFGAEIGNPALPWGDPTRFDGSSPLNSGFLGITAPASFTITFTRAGTFQYKCALHDYMGMVGTVIVLPAGSD